MPPEEKLDKLVDRFEHVARVRAETGQLDLPADAVLAQEAGTAPPRGSKRPRRATRGAVAGAEDVGVVHAAAAPMPEDLATWWAGGERVELELPGGARRSVFVRVVGEGPWLTAIHGFPTSSWDWEPVSRELRQRHRLLTFDLLGFGDSDKPSGHDWSAFEQADIIEALWKKHGVTETLVLAHDVGLTVALELLARQEDGRLSARVTDMVLLNGGVYTGFHRPRRIQVLLQKPVIGAVIARLLSEKTFSTALAEIFGPDHQPSAVELHQHWESVARRQGGRNYHRLIKYIPERSANAPRWEGALERTKLPIRFVWGMADPVSGAHMVEVIRQRRPDADIVELAGVGHYPQLEAPQRVVEAIH